MATIWILLTLSTGYYNKGTVSAVEFQSKQACTAAREEMKNQNWTDVKSICIKKGD